MGKDGWVYPHTTMNGDKNYIINNCLEPQPFYDTWTESRDGQRGYLDRSRFIPNYSQLMYWQKDKLTKNNNKLSRLLKIREARLYMRKIMNMNLFNNYNVEVSF